MPGPLSDDLAAQAAALMGQHKSIKAAARASGIPYATLHNRINVAAERGLMGTKPVLPGFAIKSTSTQRDAEGATEREWVRTTKAPGDRFEMPAGQIIKGISALTDGEGRTLAKWVKTRTDTSLPDMVQAIKASFETYKGCAKLIPAPRRTDADLLTVYPIADLHLGMLAWGRETGEAYDLPIAVARMRSCMARLVSDSKRTKHALILNLGDWQHTNDDTNATPRGHNLLDADGRYYKILESSVDLMRDCIDLALRKHARVTVRNVPGNHDPLATLALTLALSKWYHGDKRVIVDTDPGLWFFYRFGDVLIGAHHGHTVKPVDMALAMAVNRRQDWGETKYHYFYSGHIHHFTGKEVGDVNCETFRTIAGKDAYGVGAGHSSGKTLTAITMHRREGETDRHRVNLPPVMIRAPGPRR